MRKPCSGGWELPRIFLSHSSRDSREAVALKQWLEGRRPELVDDIFLDIDAQTGLRIGEKWKKGLFKSGSRLPRRHLSAIPKLGSVLRVLKRIPYR